MSRSKLFVALAVLVGVAIGGVAGYPLGSHSRNAEVGDVRADLASARKAAAASKTKLDGYQAREEQLKLREARAPKLPKGVFPNGYPKVVNVSTVPANVRDGLYDGQKKVVAVAPGVWTALPEGADIADAVASGSLDGFCASIKAYEREYTPGQVHSGSCL